MSGAPRFVLRRLTQLTSRSVSSPPAPKPRGSIGPPTHRRFTSYRSLPNSSSRLSSLSRGVAAVIVFGGCYYTLSNTSTLLVKQAYAERPPPLLVHDYQEVYDKIADKIWAEDEYEDGSYGPILLRLAWHASGTFDAASGTGGSNGATMRFVTEGSHGANKGLENAREFLEPIKKQFPWISYSDLWTLAGACAIQEMQGPTIPWRPGRKDREEKDSTPDGRLPDGARGQDHIRAVFGRMGFDDREMVALIGAHALGRCHVDRSGFDGPWTFSPTVLTNDFYRLLVDEQWQWRVWNGQKQYQDGSTKSLMMLPADMALVQDPVFKTHVERYAKDSDVFFHEFADAIVKLFELGVPFESQPEDRMRFQSTQERDE